MVDRLLPRYELQGKTAIVTGAGRGIGRAIALRLAREGADVVVADLDDSAANGVAEEVRSLGTKGLPFRVDVTKKSDIAGLVEAVRGVTRSIDLLINNAGVAAISPLMSIEESVWDSVQNVNVKGVLFCTQVVAAQMIAQQKRAAGRIINIASGAGKTAPARELGLGAYSTSKFAVIGLTKSFALELAEYGILVNCVSPGIVDTPMWDLIDREAAKREGVRAGTIRARNVASIPLGRVQLPEDVANVVAFLASEDASYITGQVVDVSGGLIMFD